MNMKQDAVADLHAALAFLKLEVAEEEIHQKLYGEETTTAVSRFHAKTGFVKQAESTRKQPTCLIKYCTRPVPWKILTAMLYEGR